MALALNYTTASSNLPAFLASWEENSAYRGNGSFNEIRNTTDQWLAGTADGSSVIVNGDNFTGTPGVVDGTVNTLDLGSNLVYSGSADAWSQSVGLSVNLNGSPLTSAWNAAISDLSQNGSLDGLYGYFAEQGTIQNGTVGNDVMLSFAGDDTLAGNLGDDTFTFADGWADDVIADFGTDTGNDDVIDLQAVTGISNYVDLLFNHSNWWDNTGVLTITDGENTLQLEGYVGTDIANLILCGNIVV